ncbi:MAG: aminopeptidase [Clostridiaceae bacterium]|jgi:aspartyl aminopeptidase|nr:aminopeptidase [Clostridiaceae bacterium]
MNQEEDKKKEEIEELRKQLTFSFKNLWDPENEEEMQAIMDFNQDYKVALDRGKTEREFVDYAIELLEANGYRAYETDKPLAAGDRVYEAVHGKALVAAVIGTADPLDGFNLIGAHVDSPRLDLKPNPMYESDELTLLKTHYYGGIKKYQWAATPLALHGVVITRDGETISLSIGEEADDPVFTITDLLPHLGADQMKKTASQVIEGEELNVLAGSIPLPGGDDIKERFKLGVLKLLFDQYGFTERDLVTAEIEIVPATKARCVGFDRSMVGGYGQDDRVCAYTALKALIDADTPLKRTGLVILYDKEETGSGGITGARSQLFPSVQKRMVRSILGREPSAIELQDQIEKSTMLSSDVSNAFDPTFASVSDPKNNTYAGRGIAFFKYTGARGKGGTSDANAEYFNEVTRLLEANDVPWQTGELGKVDQGGGGTVAIYQSDLGMSVIDCGVPVLSMHSCFEITSKIDVYKTYEAYKVFLEKMRS